MMRIDRVSTVLLFEAVSILARGGLGGPVATGDSQQKADVIAVATVTGIKDTATSVLVELQLASVLQGQAVSASLNATIPPGPPSPLRASLFASSIGATGVWFLKNDASGYVILPLVLGYFSEKDLLSRSLTRARILRLPALSLTKSWCTRRGGTKRCRTHDHPTIKRSWRAWSTTEARIPAT